MGKTYKDLFYELNPECNKEDREHLNCCAYVEFEDVKDCREPFMKNPSKCRECWLQKVK